MKMIDNLDTIFDQLPILIIGDVILDHYLMGKVDRISPEAPVPVVLHQKEVFRLGGAANVALNIKAMGAKPFLLSIIGNDFYGETFIDLLKQENIETKYILQESDYQTTCKTRVLGRNQQLLRYDREKYKEPTAKLAQDLLKIVEELITTQKIKAIVFQDYNKGLLTPDIISSIIKIALHKRIPTLADPKKNNFWAYQNINFFKPNLKEIKEALAEEVKESKELSKDLLQDFAVRIKEKINNKTTIITLGEKGIFVAQNEKYDWLPTRIRSIADVCGAGDTVIALITLGVAAKIPMKEIIVLSNLGGGQVCEKVGVVAINKVKLLEEYYKKS